jgi:hypothetical protein
LAFRAGIAPDKAAFAEHNGDIWSRKPTQYGTIPAGRTVRFLLGDSMSLSNAPCPVKTDLIHVGSAPILRFTIDFETAKSYRETRNMDCRFRKSQWNDIEVEVYL